MMRTARASLLLTALFLLGVPAGGPLAAQVVVAPAARGWIGVSFEMQTTQEGASTQTVTRVTGVLPRSAAATRPKRSARPHPAERSERTKTRA